MAQENLFNARGYFMELAETNRLAKENQFLAGSCSGLAGLETMMVNFRKAPNYILVDDTTTQSTYGNGVGYFRKDVYTIFIVAAYHHDDMVDREMKLDLCRRIFRQMHARLIHDRDGMRYRDALEYLQVDRVYSTELPRMFMSGMTGLYFMVYNDEPIDLSYDAAEWTE